MRYVNPLIMNNNQKFKSLAKIAFNKHISKGFTFYLTGNVRLTVFSPLALT